MHTSRAILFVVAVLSLAACGRSEGPAEKAPAYPWHRDVTATVFWVGEPGNRASAWDDLWTEHFGGLDDPEKREGHRPAAFEPKENPFYVALPYNDIPGGRRRADAAEIIPWAGEREWGGRESMCKNRWVAIRRGEVTCYAQWEDVGPFATDDGAYVFGDGSVAPRPNRNKNAGIDVSPAVRDCLGLPTGMAAVDWRFIAERDVPPGPWKNTITRGGIHWE